MHDGLIQQVGAPMEVYNRPANRFVAGFLGTPPMNFLEGRLIHADGRIAFVTGDVKFSLPDSIRGHLSPYVTQEVVLGIRPEHLFVEPFASRHSRVIRTTVNVIEPLGDRINLHLTYSSGNKLVANVNSNILLEPNDRVNAYVGIERVHIFKQGETGENLSLNT
ncbi:MAG: ABC transporter ATP-binding protein [Phycisphaerales bacterium]|nr:MAG: ABC transporter ATP-binding protein [Phycisphaerales bacterium]